MAVLIALSGLPGVGKTTLARHVAMRTGAILLRVDSVEAALKNSVLNISPAEDAGYWAIAAVAKDNLLLGSDVIADTVNSIDLTRRFWAQTAASGKARLFNVEVICSDKVLHRERVETRATDITGLEPPDWQAVTNRKFEPWQGPRLIVDTAIDTVDACTERIIEGMRT